MNFRETLKFCANNVIKSWGNSITNITQICLTSNPLVAPLVSAVILLPNTVATLVDFPLRPQEGVENTAPGETISQDSQNKPDRLIVDDSSSLYPNSESFLKQICTEAQIFLNYFARHGCNIIFNNIKTQGRLYTSNENHPDLSRLNYQVLEGYLNETSKACNSNKAILLNLKSACHWIDNVCNNLVIKGFEDLVCIKTLSNSLQLDILDLHFDPSHVTHYANLDEFIPYINNATALCGQASIFTDAS